MKNYTDSLIEAYGDLGLDDTMQVHGFPIKTTPGLNPANLYSDFLDDGLEKLPTEPDKYIQIKPESLNRRSLTSKILRALPGVFGISKPEEDSDFHYLYRKDNPSLFVTVVNNNYIDSYREGHPGKELVFAANAAGVRRAVNFIKKELELN